MLRSFVDRRLKEQARAHLGVLCKALDIELTAQRLAEVEAMDRDALERLLDAIGVQRRWPRQLACDRAQPGGDGMDDLYASFGIELTQERRAAIDRADSIK